ncbi:hypothetical protein BHE74_00051474 [Ensete ventricosum]|nr:hypothetical protein BHE74_00051474 [Ensete ventricosum]
MGDLCHGQQLVDLGYTANRVPNGPVRLVQARARWTATTTLRRKSRQPEVPGRYTSSVRLTHIPRDDKGKAERTDKLPSHMYKTPVSTTRSSSPRQPEGQTDQRSGRGSPRKLQPTSEVPITIDIGGLAHSDENRSSRHLSSTPESSITDAKYHV